MACCLWLVDPVGLFPGAGEYSPADATVVRLKLSERALLAVLADPAASGHER